MLDTLMRVVNSDKLPLEIFYNSHINNLIMIVKGYRAVTKIKV